MLRLNPHKLRVFFFQTTGYLRGMLYDTWQINATKILTETSNFEMDITTINAIHYSS